MEDRCSICGLRNVSKTADCPECSDIMDLSIKSSTLLWKCRKCDYGIATTTNLLCFFDNKKFAKECYSKINNCPYAYK